MIQKRGLESMNGNNIQKINQDNIFDCYNYNYYHNLNSKGIIKI